MRSMDKDEWSRPWKCKECGKLFKCQDRVGECERRGGNSRESGCYCVNHTRMASKEKKLARCNVVPHDYIPKPRKGKIISGTELIQLG